MKERGPVWPAGLTPRSLKEELRDWHGVKDPPTSPKASGMTLCSRGAAKDCRVCVRGERAEPGRRSVLWKSSSRKEMTTKNTLPNAINSPTGERIHACRGVSMIYNIYKRPGGGQGLDKLQLKRVNMQHQDSLLWSGALARQTLSKIIICLDPFPGFFPLHATTNFNIFLMDQSALLKWKEKWFHNLSIKAGK